MVYFHRFVVNASIADTRAFYIQSANMGAITPPPIIVQVHRAPAILTEGSAMEFTLWMGPLPVRWRARISEVRPGGFVDTMERGPFKRWTHEHSFVEIDDNRTEVLDCLHIEPSSNWFWWVVCQGMIMGLPGLFAYRQWQTRRLLSAQAATASHADKNAQGPAHYGRR